MCIYIVSLLLVSFPFPAASTNYAQLQIHMHIVFTEKDHWGKVPRYSIHSAHQTENLANSKTFTSVVSHEDPDPQLPGLMVLMQSKRRNGSTGHAKTQVGDSASTSSPASRFRASSIL